MGSYGFQDPVAADSRNEPPAHPKIDKRVSALAGRPEPEEILGPLGFTNEYVAKIRRQRNNVYEPWTSVLEQGIRGQTHCVQGNANLSQLRVDAFAKDAVDLSSATTLSCNYLEFRHGLTREMVRSEPGSAADAYIAERTIRA